MSTTYDISVGITETRTGFEAGWLATDNPAEADEFTAATLARNPGVQLTVTRWTGLRGANPVKTVTHVTPPGGS